MKLGINQFTRFVSLLLVKTRLDKIEEYDPPAMNEGVVNANLKLGIGGEFTPPHFVLFCS